MTQMTSKRLTIGIAGAVVFQLIVLGAMIARQARFLRSGDEIVVRLVQPVDPRDILLGHYVELPLALGRLDGADIAIPSDLVGFGDPVFVSLARRGDVWEAVSVHRKKPEAKEGQIVMSGVVSGHQDKILSVHYGIERYYIPEADVKKMEAHVRAGEMRLVLAVAPDTGRASIKRLLVDGAPIYDDPLY